MRVCVFVCVWKTERQENRTARSKEGKEINYSRSRCYGRLLPRPPLNTRMSQNSYRVHLAQVMSPEKNKVADELQFSQKLKNELPPCRCPSAESTRIRFLRRGGTSPSSLCNPCTRRGEAASISSGLHTSPKVISLVEYKCLRHHICINPSVSWHWTTLVHEAFSY